MTSNPNPGSPAPAGGTPEPGGLATVAQVEELADQLSACADKIHERVMREIKSFKGGPVPEARQAAARALLDDEVVLRQRANGLYADAATYIVRSLGKSQLHVMALTKDAGEKIVKITHIGDAVSLVARLLGIAAAVATGQPAPIMLSLEYLKHQLDLMALHNAPPPPATPPA
jgi:class 3 adenylate cyclase